MRLAAFLLAIMVDFVAAQDAGFFLNPPVGNLTTQNDFTFNPVWILGETQTIQWTTIFSNYSITLWQQSLAGGSATAGPAILTTLPGASSITQFSWTVSDFNFDLRLSPVFFLWLTPGPPSDGTISMTSHYFNISAAASSSSTTSVSSSVSPTISSTLSATPTPSVQSTTSSSTTNASSKNPTSSSASTQSSGLSTGVKIGVAFGAVILVAIIGGAGIFFAMKRRKKERTSLLPPYPQKPQQKYTHKAPQREDEHEELQIWREPVELG